MARVPFAQRDTMTLEGQQVWDEIEGSRGGVARNYAAILNNPQAAQSYATLGGYVRFESPLDPRVKALAVLTAAKAMAMTVIDLLSDGAQKALEIKREFRAPMTSAAYLKLMRGMLKEETFRE